MEIGTYSSYCLFEDILFSFLSKYWWTFQPIIYYSDIPQQIKSEQSMANTYVSTNQLAVCRDAPIDLSRRCDSVETRKTPSPFNSSTFGESSPSMLSDSPSSLSRNVRASLINQRSPSLYQLNSFDESTYPMSTFGSSSLFSAFMKPNKSKASAQHNEPIDRCFSYEDSPTSPNRPSSFDVMNPFVVQALQQKLQTMATPQSTNKTITPPQELISSSTYPMIMGLDGKLSRPFKAYPKNPLSIAAYVPPADSLLDRESSERYNNYRNRVMQEMFATRGSCATVSMPKMRRMSSNRVSTERELDQQDSNSIAPTQQLSDVHNLADSGSPTNSTDTAHGLIKDSAYFERRRKNNAAAKKSRDRRRIKEDEIAIRAAILERENMELKIELTAIKRQLSLYMSKWSADFFFASL